MPANDSSQPPPRVPWTRTGLLRFEEPTGARADLAFELLSEGKFVSFRDLQLHVAPSGELECCVYSQWEPEDVNSVIARQEFAVGQDTLAQLLDGSPQFASLCRRPCQWELRWDYGNGAIRLCSLRGGLLVWAEGFPKRSDAPDA